MTIKEITDKLHITSSAEEYDTLLERLKHLFHKGEIKDEECRLSASNE